MYGGLLAMLADLVQTHGEDSVIVKIAAPLYGSTETTFYVIAVYFGAVSISKNTLRGASRLARRYHRIFCGGGGVLLVVLMTAKGLPGI